MDVQISTGVGATGVKALIDTGAPRTIFPRGIGVLLGVEFPELPMDCPKKIAVLGGEWPAVTDSVELCLRPFSDIQWHAEVDFMFHEGLPFGILGLEGFLDRWAVSFDGYHGFLVVETADEFADTQDPELLSKFREQWPGV